MRTLQKQMGEMEPEKEDSRKTGVILIADLVNLTAEGVDNESGVRLVKYILKDTNGAVKDEKVTLTGVLELVKRGMVSSEDAAKIIREMHIC